MSAWANIEIWNLRYSYRVGGFALELPRLSLSRGQAVACIGPSGSGKTTLLHLLAGIVVPQKGSILVGETQVSSLPEKERRRFRIGRLGLVFQEFELLDYLSVQDNILLPFRLSRALLLSPKVRDRAGDLARRMGLGEKLRRNVRELSQGERQRVALCRALVTRPQWLLADEPTGNLDPGNKQRVVDLLFDAAATSGAGLLVVTHDHGILDRFSRVIDLPQLTRAEEGSAGK